MSKIVDFNGIGYVAATFPVGSELKTYLEQNHLNAKTGNVDINGKNLGVSLDEDGTLKFGSSESADAPLLGIIIAYEMDGFASVQIKGGVDEVPTKGELTTGVSALGVNNKGEIDSFETGPQIIVAKPASAESKFASIIL